MNRTALLAVFVTALPLLAQQPPAGQIGRQDVNHPGPWDNDVLVYRVTTDGCAAPTIYSWGQYESVIYTAYTTPDKMPLERQVELLEADYQKARSQNKPVPPG